MAKIYGSGDVLPASERSLTCGTRETFLYTSRYHCRCIIVSDTQLLSTHTHTRACTHTHTHTNVFSLNLMHTPFLPVMEDVPDSGPDEEYELDPEREAYYKDDPKKALKKFFDREGLELEYEANEHGTSPLQNEHSQGQVSLVWGC